MHNIHNPAASFKVRLDFNFFFLFAARFDMDNIPVLCTLIVISCITRVKTYFLNIFVKIRAFSYYIIKRYLKKLSIVDIGSRNCP